MISKISYAATLYYAIALVLQTMVIAFLGNKYNDDTMITGIGLVNLYVNATCLDVYWGLIAGLETLAANAFSANQFKLMGFYFHRARIIGYAWVLFVMTIHAFTAIKVIELLYPNANLEYSKKYIYCLMGYTLFDVQTCCCTLLLNVLEKTYICMIICVVGFPLHYFFCWLYIDKLDLDTLGGGLCMLCTRAIGGITMTIYLWFWHPIPEANFWINRKCFRWDGLKSYLKFSIGAAFLSCSESWGVEILAVLAMQIDETAYAVHIIWTEINELVYSLPVGFGIAITVYIGQIIVHGSEKQIKKASWIFIGYCAFIEIIFRTVIYILREKIFDIFGLEDEKIKKLGYESMQYISYDGVLQNIQMSIVSILKGMGKQYLASIFMFLEYYVFILISAAVCICRFGFGYNVLMLNITASYAVSSILFVIVFLTVNIKRAKYQTKKRLKEDRKMILNEAQREKEEIPQVGEILSSTMRASVSDVSKSKLENNPEDPLTKEGEVKLAIEEKDNENENEFDQNEEDNANDL